jgi:dipeptidyl aminopeptidase/acylaminoacyl peptidase
MIAQAATSTAADHHHKDQQPSTVFYANDARGELRAVTLTDGRVSSTALAHVASPVWWRTFYLTPTAAAGDWVVGMFSGDQKDVLDAPRMFAFDPTTKTLNWLAKPSFALRSPVVTATKQPEVYYLSGSTVRETTTAATHDHLVYTAPSGWRISALTVSPKAVPYVSLTRTTGLLLPTTTTYVVQLAPKPKTVLASAPGWVSALAISPDGATLAVSRVKPTGDSVLTLNAEAKGGLQKTLPNLGMTSQMSWSPDGTTLAVDPEEWGGLTLVDVATGRSSYPGAMQPYGGGVFGPLPTTTKSRKD